MSFLENTLRSLKNGAKFVQKQLKTGNWSNKAFSADDIIPFGTVETQNTTFYSTNPSWPQPQNNLEKSQTRITQFPGFQIEPHSQGVNESFDDEMSFFSEKNTNSPVYFGQASLSPQAPHLNSKSNTQGSVQSFSQSSQKSVLSNKSFSSNSEKKFASIGPLDFWVLHEQSNKSSNSSFSQSSARQHDRKPTPFSPFRPSNILRKCVHCLQPFNKNQAFQWIRCPGCSKLSCQKCTVQCEKCSEKYCGFCAGPMYSDSGQEICYFCHQIQ